MISVRSAETARTLFLLLALVLLFILPLLRFKFQAFVALYSVRLAICAVLSCS